MKHEVKSGTVDGQYFVISIFDDSEAISHMKIGLEQFFEKFDKFTRQKERIKKELDHGYLSLSDSGNSSRTRE